MQREVLVAGHYCHDLLVDETGERRELGGSAAYASTVLSAAQIDFAVLAKVGEDFLYGGRIPPPEVVPGARTTSFVDEYRAAERVQTLHARSPPIAPEEVRERSAIGLAVPIAGEIPPATLSRLRESCRLLIADAQGFVRTWDAGGRILHSPPRPEVLAGLLRVDYLKVGREEAAVLDLPRLRQTCTVLITDGARGSTVLTATGETHVPAFPARQVDPTGAGDCFLAGFAVGLLRGYSPERAARLGNWCGARAVEAVGIPAFPPLPIFD